MSDKPLDNISSDFVKVGKILSPHGVKGFLKLKSFTNNPKEIFEFDFLHDAKGKRSFKLILKSSQDPKKNIYIIQIENVNDRTEAEKLTNLTLYTPRQQFEKIETENEFYQHDLIGILVKSIDGKELGKVVSINDFGAGDILEYSVKDSKKTEMIIFSNDFIEKLDLENKEIIIKDIDIL